jgi:maltooligosyltrehalose trehalohydrolase
MNDKFTEEVIGKRPVGVSYSEGISSVSVWAPMAKQVHLKIKDRPGLVDLHRDIKGYWNNEVGELSPGNYYKFVINGQHELPDPASSYQPEGVHSWSEVVDHQRFSWKDKEWRPLPLDKMVVYELHVGTFTEEGNFEGIMSKLNHFLNLGINTIQLMPISQFPGDRNWGYDGVFPFAVQNSYGGVTKLKQLVNECHQNGINVILDVVFNHLGPEGNYLSQFGPYFTSKYSTPWGDALNFDDEYSDEVRNYFIQCALMWIRDYHFDGLRLDAVHAIYDQRPDHFLKTLRQHVADLEKSSGKAITLIAESDLNDVKMVKSEGYGLEGVWADDFHHSLHTLVTGEDNGYYSDFGTVEHFSKSFCQALVYDGVYSKNRKRTVGSKPLGIPPERFVVCIQNHDQVGNRMRGDRISTLVSFEAAKLMAGAMLSSPYTPMLFMGEEYGESRPFCYFTSHSDEDLIKAVQEGRKKEFSDFEWEGEVPDPHSTLTFNESKLAWQFDEEPEKATLFRFYQHLISLRKDGVFQSFRKDIHRIILQEQPLEVAVFTSGSVKPQLFAAFNFSKKGQEILLPEAEKNWQKIISSSDSEWMGPTDMEQSMSGGKKLYLSPSSIAIYGNNT